MLWPSGTVSSSSWMTGMEIIKLNGLILTSQICRSKIFVKVFFPLFRLKFRIPIPIMGSTEDFDQLIGAVILISIVTLRAKKRLKKCLIIIFSLLLLINKKCASHFRRELSNKNKQLNETKTWIYGSCLIRQSF